VKTALALAGVLLASLVWAACAFAEPSPWWHLTAGSRPTALHAGLARNEVQKVTVAAKGGEFILADLTKAQLAKGEFSDEPGDEPDVVSFPFNAEPGVVQARLEEVYGAGNVEVSGGPGDETGSKPYVVTFKGGRGSQRVEEMQPFAFGLTGTETVTETTRGRPDGEIVLTAANLGDASVNGETTPVSIVDKLPVGLKAVSIEAEAGENSFVAGNRGPVPCSLGSLTCTFGGTYSREGTIVAKTLPPYDQIEERIGVLVEGATSGELNEASVSGGEAANASIKRPIAVGGSVPFGIEDYGLALEEEGGSSDTQAGSHPFQLTSTVTVNQAADANPAALPKDLSGALPPGLIGNPTPIPRCTIGQFLAIVSEIEGVAGLEHTDECSAQSAVGVATVTVNEPTALKINTFTLPIFNLEPAVGEPARFGFLLPSTPVVLDAAVRTGGDYGVTVSSTNISQTAALLSVKLIFWGVPGDQRHDNARGWGCLGAARELKIHLPCNAQRSHNPPPFLALPTSCTRNPGTGRPEPLFTTLAGDSWEHPGARELLARFTMLPVNGCNRLLFSPEVRVTPDGTAASTPTGLNVDVHVPQDSVLTTNGLAESAVKDISVALPEGVAVNPAGGDGLQACGEGLVGFEGFSELESEPGEPHPIFSAKLPEPLEPGVNFCPDASKIGTVEISTPLLPPGQHVKGFVYLATQNQNPFGSLIALYLIAKDPISGFVFKAVGETHLTASGQVIGTFKKTPQLAFEDAELHFFGGERAPLATPARCGPYTTSATFTPWSGNEPVNSASTFNVTSGPNGGPCPGASLPFSPSLTGGAPNINAGAFSALTTTIGREDGQQDMQSVTLHMPAGLSGLLSSVKLCPEAQANEGTCGPESLIGETTVSAGVGNDPVTVKGGRVYITEHYAGAPFGLSIVNPVKAGPFDLEHDTSNPAQQPACDCVVVRAKIEVDPHSAALTVTTDPTGPHAIPHLIDGIPVQIKNVNVLVNRPSFTFNPTNCDPLAITGTISSDEGASQALSVPFQVTNCAVLKYTPHLSVSTAAHTSKANGASLLFNVTYPKGAMGTQSWFRYAKFELPRQLPARLTTIQKACLAATFESNPAACPAGSVIGHATVHTQVLPVPLTGPVYFVSHGGAKFPDAVVVLQGYGITVDLVGETFISKAGITSATFRNTPDVPFESIEVTVPSGPFSEFGANLPAKAHGSFCGQKLIMPIIFKAQNGLEIHQNTPIAVTGCPKAKTRAQLLAAALTACRKKHGRGRASCEKAARKAYGARVSNKKRKR
jgi:hypothetical protein